MRAVSVIIPAHNAELMLPLGLTALSIQNLPHTQFEVIVVDDASTDRTIAAVSGLRLPFDLKLIRQPTNAGAAAARNRGADAAEGDLLVFCDADTIGSPNYLRRHLQIHQVELNKPLLVSGAARWKPLYTSIYPRMSPGFVWTVRQLAQTHPWIADRLPKGWEHTDRPIQLARIRDVKTGRIVAFRPPTDWPGFMHQVVGQVGERLDDFPTAWMACMGSNFSVPTQLFQDVGGFDTDFQGYGQEDWELGYRLQQAGAGVHCGEQIANYHQERPSSTVRRQIANMRNYQHFAAKHPSSELDFFAVCQVGGDWGPLRLGRLFAELKSARNRPELRALTNLFSDLAGRYRSWVGIRCQAPPYISWVDRQRTWTQDQVGQHNRALRCLGTDLSNFSAGLFELATADTTTAAVSPSASQGFTVVHLVGWPGMDDVSTYIRDACHLISKLGGVAVVVGEGGPAKELLQNAANRYLRYGLDVDHLHSPNAQAEEIAYVLAALRPDVIHCHKTEQLAVAVHLAKLLGCRLAITLHAMEFTRPEFEAAWPQADSLLFFSDAIAQGFAHRFGPPPMRWKVSAPGISLASYRPGRRDHSWLEQHHISSSAPLVIYAGRLGLDTLRVPAQLMQVTGRLRDRFPDLRVIVIGPGSDQLAGQAAAVNLDAGQEVVHLLPPQSDLRPIYRAATVVVGSGRVAMEALATGRPVIAYGAAGFVGLVEPQTLDGATSSNFGDHAAPHPGDGLELYQALTNLLGNPQRRAALVRFGRQSAEQSLGLDQLEQGLRFAYSR